MLNPKGWGLINDLNQMSSPGRAWALTKARGVLELRGGGAVPSGKPMTLAHLSRPSSCPPPPSPPQLPLSSLNVQGLEGQSQAWGDFERETRRNFHSSGAGGWDPGASTKRSSFQRSCCSRAPCSSLVSWLRACQQKPKPPPATSASLKGLKRWALQCDTCRTQRASWRPLKPNRPESCPSQRTRTGARGGSSSGPRPKAGGPDASRWANQLADPRSLLLLSPRQPFWVPGCTCQCLCTCSCSWAEKRRQPKVGLLGRSQSCGAAGRGRPVGPGDL